MENEITDKRDLIEKITDILKKKKKILFLILFIIVLFLSIMFFLDYSKSNENEKISEQYIKAGIHLTSNEKEKSKLIYKEIILSKNKFKVEGKKKDEVKKLIKESISIQKAGAFSIVLECITPNTSKIITNLLKIPTIGIGSSSYCDGQILVTDDIIGLSGFYPKFVKKYVSLNTIIEKAVKIYSKEVKTKVFPKNKNFLYGK